MENEPKENNLMDAINEDANRSGNVVINTPVDTLRKMTQNPNGSGDFYLRGASDYSGTVSTKLGIKILVVAVVLGSAFMLIYGYFFS